MGNILGKISIFDLRLLWLSFLDSFQLFLHFFYVTLHSALQKGKVRTDFYDFFPQREHHTPNKPNLVFVKLH